MKTKIGILCSSSWPTFFRTFFLAFSLIACTFISFSAVAQSRQPNIVIILADDLGYGDVSYNRVNPDFLTPNIDSLTINGVQCTNGYVTHPFCSPSRAALLTGRYQQRFGYENQPNEEVLDNTNPRLGLPLTELTLSELLQPAGYACGIIGKWHLGIAPSLLPNQRGFDYFYGFLTGNADYYGERMLQNGTPASPPGPDPYCSSPRGAYLTDLFTQQAVSFINSNAAQPFFLYLAYYAPHNPYETPPICYMNQVASITDPNRQIYAAMVTALDFGVGQVLQALQANNLLSNTLIFFLSDNGAPASNYTQLSNYPLHGWKLTLWEGGIRVPFAIQWTGTLPGNVVYNQPVSSLDIVATAAAAAGVSLPTDRVYDGINLLPYLTGQQVSPQRTLFWRWFGLGPSGPVGSVPTIYAVRSGDLKLLQQGRVQLFNLTNDIGETRDLSNIQPGDAASLQQSWNQWNAQMIEPLWAAPVF
jgi:arylsulfatase A-like enzyme